MTVLSSTPRMPCLSRQKTLLPPRWCDQLDACPSQGSSLITIQSFVHQKRDIAEAKAAYDRAVSMKTAGDQQSREVQHDLWKKVTEV